MAIDRDGRLARTRWPGFHEPSTDIHRVGADPTLLLSSDFPLTTGRDGSVYYPGLGEDDVLRVFRLTPAGERSGSTHHTPRRGFDGCQQHRCVRLPAPTRRQPSSRSISARTGRGIRRHRVRGGQRLRCGAQDYEAGRGHAGAEVEVGGLKLCWCPPGRFQMGSPAGEAGRRADEAEVEVTLSKGFWAGKYEVTQGQWKREMGAVPGKLIAGWRRLKTTLRANSRLRC